MVVLHHLVGKHYTPILTVCVSLSKHIVSYQAPYLKEERESVTVAYKTIMGYGLCEDTQSVALFPGCFHCLHMHFIMVEFHQHHGASIYVCTPVISKQILNVTWSVYTYKCINSSKSHY